MLLTRSDGSEVKDYEALIEYIQSQCQANSGTLPPQYNTQTTAGHLPRRMVCTGPLCP
jgi:hypothetical protein